MFGEDSSGYVVDVCGARCTASLATRSQNYCWWQGVQSMFLWFSGHHAPSVWPSCLFFPHVLRLFYLIKACLIFYFISPSCLNRCHNMGNLLKVLTCTDLEQGPNFFLDFESENIILYISSSLPAVDCIRFLHYLCV